MRADGDAEVALRRLVEDATASVEADGATALSRQRLATPHVLSGPRRAGRRRKPRLGDGRVPDPLQQWLPGQDPLPLLDERSVCRSQREPGERLTAQPSARDDHLGGRRPLAPYRPLQLAHA